MPKVTVICYLSSLLLYGMGYSKMVALNTGYLNTHDFTTYVSLATVYFVLTIFLAVIGSFFLYVKYIKNQEIDFSVKDGRELENRAQASIPNVKGQLSQSKYGMELERRMTS